MTPTRRLALLTAFTAATVTGCSDKAPRAAGTTDGPADLVQEVQELRDSVAQLREELRSTSGNVKKYFSNTGSSAKSDTSMYAYVDSLALLVCEMKDKLNAKPGGHGVCQEERQEKIAPPTYPPR